MVKDKTNHIQHEVPCGRWLSARDSDGLTIREFPVSFSTTFKDSPGKEHTPQASGLPLDKYRLLRNVFSRTKEIKLYTCATLHAVNISCCSVLNF